MTCSDGIAGALRPRLVNSAPANTKDTLAKMSRAPFGPTPAAPSPWPAQQSPVPRGPSRTPVIAAIVIALVAVAVAVGAWFRPAPKAEVPAAKTYTATETADAKKAVCDAYSLAHRAIQATGRKNGGTDPTSIIAVAVNVRLALSESSSFLLRTLDEHPATSPELEGQVRTAANAFQNIAIDQLGEAPQAAIDPFLMEGDSADAMINKACSG